MGFLLKIVLFGVAIYAVWRTVAHWKGLFDRVTGQAQPRVRPAPSSTKPAPASPAPAPRHGEVIDVSATCRVCGAYLSSAATKCSRPECPLP